MTGNDPCQIVRDAAARTIGGSARVTIWASAASGDDDIPGEMTGVVDFDSDRCELDGTEATVLDGPITYKRLPDGRWTVDEGMPGTWGIFHPRAVLEGLRRGCAGGRQSAARRFSVQVDRDVLDAIVHPGVAAAWDVSADAGLDENGRVRRVVLNYAAVDQPGDGFSLTFEFGDFGPAREIDVPDKELTIPVAEYIAEQLGDQGS